MMFPRFTSRNVFWALYFLIATVFFLYFLFPTNKFKDFCEFKVSEMLADGNCKIGEIVYQFPGTVSFKEVVLKSGTGRDVSVLHVKALAISNNGLRFWKDFEVRGEVFSGALTAMIELDWGNKQFKMSDIKATDIDMANWEKEENFSQREMFGSLSFLGSYDGELGNPFSGKGQGRFELKKAGMELVQPILSLEEVTFEKVSSELKYEAGVVYFTDGKFAGNELSGEFSGVATMAKPLVKSGLTVNGHLNPQLQFLENHPREQRLIERLLKRYGTQKLPFQVGGTLQRPTFRFAT